MSASLKSSRAAHHGRNRHQSECARKAKRGANRIHRNTYDMNSKEAQPDAQLGEDGTLEASQMTCQALLQTVKEVRRTTATSKYSQGIITRVGEAAMHALFDTDHGFDHFYGTNDLANSQIAEAATVSKRQWHRVKPVLGKLGLISYVHRSTETGLVTESHLQISDLYWFSPENLVPWIREVFDQVLAGIKAKVLNKEKGKPRVRTPLVKRERPPRRSPSILNPIGWARALAADAAAFARPALSYASEEARALAWATNQAANTTPG